MGVYCLVQALPMLSMLASLVIFARNSEGASVAMAFLASIFPGGMMLLTGILLLIFSNGLARRLSPISSLDEKNFNISFDELSVLAFTVTGILIFADSLPQLANSCNTLLSWVTTEKQDQMYQPAYSKLTFYEISAAAGVVVKAILGATLFFRARGFVNFWRSLKTFGTPKSSQD
jgi:hypothetical protein